MTDLTCRSPEIFNIRHTERGVQTRNTKRKGGNLHCIMAFKKAEPSPSGFFFSVEQSISEHQPQPARSQSANDAANVVLVPDSEIEDLNSSDSDYPPEVISKSERFRNGGQEEERLTSLTDTNGKEVLEAWSSIAGVSTGTAAQEGERSANNNIIKIPVVDLEMEDVDGSRVEHEGDEDPLDSTLTEEHGVFTAIVPSPPQAELDSPSSRTAVTVPPKKAASSPPQYTATNSSTTASQGSPTFTRTGTYRKKRPTLSPNRDQQQTLLSSSSDEEGVKSPSSVKRRSRSGGTDKGKKTFQDNVESTASLNVETSPHTGGGVQRRGTFTKEVPTIRVERTRPLSSTSNSSDREEMQSNNDENEFEGVDFDSPFESELRRSGTFTKRQPQPCGQAPPSEGDTTELIVNTESISPGSNLRRSGTFTKEKPDVLITKTRQSSTSSTSEKETLSDSEIEVVPVTSGMKRSGTFTIEKQESTEDDHSVISTDLLDYEAVDFDDTLKDSKVHDDSGDDCSEGSADETMFLTNELAASPMKRSGTFTKEKPFLS